MLFCHRHMDRQMDTDIIPYVRDVYITSRAKNIQNSHEPLSQYNWNDKCDSISAWHSTASNPIM